MTIELNHTIVAVDDKHTAGQFFADLVGIAGGVANGPFIAVAVNDRLTLDFDDRRGAQAGHYAFLVDDATFDHILRTAQRLEANYGSGTTMGWDRTINHLGGGRAVYVQDPNGHSYEFFTVAPG